MLDNRASRTADTVLALRALESERPAEERLWHQPAAAKMMPRWVPIAGPLHLPWRWAFGLMAKIAPEFYCLAQLRTLYFDRCLREATAMGIKQFVILGAGYDLRGHDPKVTGAGVRVFEVDHPATQAEKLRRLERAGMPEQSANIAYVAVDFTKDDLAKAMADAGYNESLPSFILLEGVSYYLKKVEFETTLAWIARHGDARTRLAFDYLNENVITGQAEGVDARRIIQGARNAGEPMHFGLSPEHTAEFLTNLGLQLLQDFDCEGLRREFPAVKSAPSWSYFRFGQARPQGS